MPIHKTNIKYLKGRMVNGNIPDIQILHLKIGRIIREGPIQLKIDVYINMDIYLIFLSFQLMGIWVPWLYLLQAE